MARNWAIVIGINGYNPNNFTPLRYARRDAELVRDFFVQEARFEQVYFFSDNSPSIPVSQGVEYPSYPSYGNLISFLQDLCAQPRLQPGDNFWFFFAGHGERFDDRDYLMPIDANSRGNKLVAALPVSDVRELLCRSGADNVILIMDACRNQGARSGAGIGNEVQQGVITIASCSPTQTSWEIEELQQGAFTYALLEALRLPGERSCATVERLDNYLKRRVPDLCNLYEKAPVPTPRISADPSEKHHFILLPQHAWDSDIAIMKTDAYRAEVNQRWDLARQLWIRINAAASGRDTEVFEAFERIARGRGTIPAQPQPPDMSQSTGGRSTSSTTTSPDPYPPAQQSGKGRVAGEKFGLDLGASSREAQRQREQAIASANERQSNQHGQQADLGQSQPPTQPEDDLSSEKGIDYTQLRDLLKAQKWKEADTETYQRMLQAVGRKDGDWIRAEELKTFPCADLKTIDRLWVKYSNGHFGFSVQKQIWQECGSPTSPGKDWDRFCVRVGWQTPNAKSYVEYLNFKFDPQKSPAGELPGWGGEVVWVCLFSRIETCRV
jgi:uncharacterized caspase-like protein